MRTDTVDLEHRGNLPSSEGSISQIDVKNLPPQKQNDLYQSLGSTLTELATSENTAHNPAFGDARSTAIVLLEKSQKINETRENYLAMGRLFNAGGDTVHATAADVLASLMGLPTIEVHSELHINSEALRSNLQRGVAAEQSKAAPGVF